MRLAIALALAATLAGAAPNGWDRAAFVFDVAGSTLVGATLGSATVAIFAPRLRTVTPIIGWCAVGAMVLGGTLQGVAAWSHHESIVPDFGVGVTFGSHGLAVRVR